jgi:hypothetical protein
LNKVAMVGMIRFRSILLIAAGESPDLLDSSFVERLFALRASLIFGPIRAITVSGKEQTPSLPKEVEEMFSYEGTLVTFLRIMSPINTKMDLIYFS